jgi:hypothetical protein
MTLRIGDKLNVLVLPEKIGHVNGMQITYDFDDNRRRNLFVYASSGKVSALTVCLLALLFLLFRGKGWAPYT